MGRMKICLITLVIFLIASCLLFIQFNDGYVFGEDNGKIDSRITGKEKRRTRKQNQNAFISNISTIFSDDFVPDIYNTTVIDGSSTIHFCLIAAKAEIAEEIRFLVRSVILHARRCDVFFHFVVLKGSNETIPSVFDEVRPAFVNVKYELVEVNLNRYINKKLHNKVHITHKWSGLYGVGKIFMYDLFPHVDKCIVIDTDLIFGTDPAFLWSEGQTKVRPPVAVATTLTIGDTSFSSGVMIHDFSYMRKIKFEKFITMKGCTLKKANGTKKFHCYHDQMFLNVIKNEHRELFDSFTQSWNLGKCSRFKNFKFNSFQDKITGLFFGIVHLTCFPPKMKNVFIAGKKSLPKNVQSYIDVLDEIHFQTLDGKQIQRVL